jgi:hypothetical protein
MTIIRPSSLSTFIDCGRRFAARHLTDTVMAAGFELNTTGPTHIGAAVGSGVHAGAAYTLETKRETGEIGNDSEAEDRAITEFKDRAQHGLSWDETSASLPIAQKQIARMTMSYRRQLAPKIQPLLVEQRLDVDAGDGWTISGQADTIAGDPDDQPRDLKTGKMQRANGIQYGAYAVIFRTHGYNVRSFVEDFVPRVSIKHEQPLPTTLEIDLSAVIPEFIEAVSEIKRAAGVFGQRLETGEAPPETAFRANPASALCSPRWCPAHGTKFCRAHKGGAK